MTNEQLLGGFVAVAIGASMALRVLVPGLARRFWIREGITLAVAAVALSIYASSYGNGAYIVLVPLAGKSILSHGRVRRWWIAKLPRAIRNTFVRPADRPPENSAQ